MIQSTQHPKPKQKKHLPKGTFSPDLLQKYLQIKNYLLTSPMYSLVCPFKYHFMNYIILKKQTPNQGQILQLYHQTFNIPILKAIPKHGQIGCKYQIYQSQTNALVSYLRGDLLCQKFYLFDSGFNPNKHLLPIRKQLAYITVTNNQFFSRKPPNISAMLPNRTIKTGVKLQLQKPQNYVIAQGIQQIQSSTSQILKISKQNNEKIYTLNSIQPLYCEIKKGYVLDLKGLIIDPSPINTIMKTKNNQDCFIMGKRSCNTYLMFVGIPLSLLQGFGIFIANFVAKKH